MVGQRPFNGSRTGAGRNNPVVDLVKLEIQKKGKLPAAARYKYILNKRMETAYNMHGMQAKVKGSLFTQYKDKLNQKINQSRNNKIVGATGRARSKRAEQALKEMAMKKAAKEEKVMRQMVVVQPRNYHNGSINAKGRIYDIANNYIGNVNTKNGKMTAVNGWSIGKYKPKSVQTNLAIQDAINKYSPYYINMRKMQAMQQGMGGEEVVNLYGPVPQNNSTLYSSPNQNTASLSDYYGTAAEGPRQNVGMTAWGAMSNNTWGTFADNAWGTVSDNAWGTASTDVWGGISAGGLWGVKGPKVWGTGNGVNYLKRLTNFLASFFGLKTKHSAAMRDAFIARRRSSSRESGASQRTTTTTRR